MNLSNLRIADETGLRLRQCLSEKKASRVAQSVARLTEKPKLPGSISSPAHTSMEIDQEIFSTVIPPLPLKKDSCQLLAIVWALSTG